MTKFEATESFAKICEAWSSWDPNGSDVKVWTKALAKYDAKAIPGAIQEYMEHNGHRKPLLNKFCEILRSDAPVVRDETMKCNMGVGVFVQCTKPGTSGPLLGTYHEVLLYHGKDVPIEHHSYIEAGNHTINKHLTQTYQQSEWRVIEQATHAEMIKARYEMRFAANQRALTGV